MSRYSIKDLEKLTGIKAHTIRIWEKRYDLVTPSRTKSNIRYYTDSDLKRLMNIAILNRNGIKISVLAEMSTAELHDRVLGLMTSRSLYDRQVESLVLAMVDFNETRFEKIFGNMVLEMGFEEVLLKVVHPFAQKVSMLWQTGAISPVHEHFVTNILRQKILTSIENLESKTLPRSKQFLLFLHDKEICDTDLLIYRFLLKKVGHRVVYLGQATPCDELRKVVAVHPPDGMITTFNSSIAPADIEEIVANLAKSFPDTIIYISGIQLNNPAINIPPNARRIESPATFKQELIGMLR